MKPTIIEEPSLIRIEAAQARWWRKSIMKLSQPELARRLGYQRHNQVAEFENGYDRKGRPLSAGRRERYRLMCAGLAGNSDFKWGQS